MTKRLNIKYLAAGLVALVTFLVYLPALQNEFVNWDDDDYVYENPYIQKINVRFFRWAFIDFHAANWHPFTWISHAIDYALWGLNPLGHHLANNILHSMNTLLVVLLVIKLVEVFEESRRQGGTPSVFLQERTKLIIGAVAGLLFGIHPLHVESVAWISERKDLLCALFFLLSILSYAKYARADDEADKRKLPLRFLHKQYLFSFGFFALALLSKPMAVTLPAVLLIIDWHPYRRIYSVRTFMEKFKEKLPFFFLSLLSSLVTILAQSSGKALVPLEDSTVASRVVIGAKALILYLYKIVFPVHLIPFYPYPEHVSLLSFQYSFFVLLVIGIAAASIAAARKQKIWLAVWLYYVITLLPVLGIIRVGAQSMADRYAYLPTLGHFILAGLGAAVFFGKVFDLLKREILAKALVSVMSGLAVILLSYATISQISIWKSSIILWSYVIETQPQQVPLAYYNRGLVYGKQNQLGLARDDFNNALLISPRFDMAYNNRGVVSFLEERYDKACEDFTKATELNRSNSEAYINRAYVYLKTGKNTLAVSDLKSGCDLGNTVGCIALKELLGGTLPYVR